MFVNSLAIRNSTRVANHATAKSVTRIGYNGRCITLQAKLEKEHQKVPGFVSNHLLPTRWHKDKSITYNRNFNGLIFCALLLLSFYSQRKESEAEESKKIEEKSPKLQLDQTRELMEKVGPYEIQAIASLIISNIVNNLGRERYQQIADTLFYEVLANPKRLNPDDQPVAPYLSPEQLVKFITYANYPVREELTSAFSSGKLLDTENDLITVCYFTLSDYWPKGLLHEANELFDLQLSSFNLPPKYDIYLKIDAKEAIKTSSLVFVLQETLQGQYSSREVFSEKRFILSENTIVPYKQEGKKTITKLLAENLGRTDGVLCLFPTPYDKDLALASNSYLIQKGFLDKGCGAPRDPTTCEELEEITGFERRNIEVLAGNRERYLNLFGGVSCSCHISEEELYKLYEIKEI